MPIAPAELFYDISNAPPATPEGVAAFLGRPGDAQLIAVAAQHLPLIANMVRGYTRGRGFTGQEAVPELAAVIVTATARLATNPEQTIREQIGDYSISPAVFNGFTLVELFTLNRYRTRAQ